MQGSQLSRTRTTARRAGLVAALAIAALLAWAVPAFAHVEIEADKAQAGATDVTVSFNAEAENDKAGATSVEVFMPPGIAPADVSLVSGPGGWTLTPTATSVKVAGPAVKIGQDAEFKLKIAKLPVDATTLPFKTLVTYADNRVDRWIEIPVAGQAEPEHPAPVLTVAPAAVVPTTPAATASLAPAPLPSTAAATPVPNDGSNDGSNGGGSSTGWIIALAVLVVLAIVGGLWWMRRRSGGGDATP